MRSSGGFWFAVKLGKRQESCWCKEKRGKNLADFLRKGQESSWFKDKRGRKLTKSSKNYRLNSAGTFGRLIFYTAITSMLPLFWIKPLLDYDWEVLIRHRFISNFNFERNTEEYMKSFGWFEIVGRSVGLVMFFGSFLLCCCCKKKKLVKTRHGKRAKNIGKARSRFFGVLMGFTMFYPLVFLAINYYTSGPEVGLKLCSKAQILMAFNYLAPVFDVISKFNGAYVVLLYVLYGFPEYQKNWGHQDF